MEQQLAVQWTQGYTAKLTPAEINLIRDLPATTPEPQHLLSVFLLSTKSAQKFCVNFQQVYEWLTGKEMRNNSVRGFLQDSLRFRENEDFQVKEVKNEKVSILC